MRTPKLHPTTRTRLECIPEHAVPPSMVSVHPVPVSTGARIAFAHALGSDPRAWRVFVQLGCEADPLATEVSADTAHAVLAQMRKTAEAQPGAYPFAFLHRTAHLLPMPPTPLPATQRPVQPAARHLCIIDDAGLDTCAEQQQPRWARCGVEPLPLSLDVPPSKELGGFYAPYVIGQPRLRIARAFRMQHCRFFHAGVAGACCAMGVHCNFIHFDFWVRGAGHREFQLCQPSAPEGEPGILAVVVPEFDFQRFAALEALVDHPINQHNINRFVVFMAAKYATDWAPSSAPCSTRIVRPMGVC